MAIKLLKNTINGSTLIANTKPWLPNTSLIWLPANGPNTKLMPSLP